MSEAWEGLEPSPIEWFHGELMDAFHEYRNKECNGDTTVLIDGMIFNRIIYQTKKKLYSRYRKLSLDNPVDKNMVEL